MQPDLSRTLALFPALTQDPHKLKVLLEAGWDGDNERRRKRRLPWQTKNFARSRPLSRRALFAGSSAASEVSSYHSLTRTQERFGESTISPGGGGVGNGFGGGWRDSDNSLDASLTSKKTMESLSASVYDDLQPFRLAHKELIKNRMALKRATKGSKASRAGRRNNSTSHGRRKKSPLATGLEKIALVASSFAWTHGKQCIRGIQRRGLTSCEFKEQLQMTLHIFLRPSEGTAVAGFFDPDGLGLVNGEYFVRWFLHSGNKYREERLARQAAEGDEEQRQQREKQREKKAVTDAENKAMVEAESSAEDGQEALAILARVALSYHDQRTGRDAAQREFACALAPHDFREQLLLSFGIRLTDPQFSALFGMMDANGDRYIDGAEFLRFFFGLGNGERAKEQKQHEVNCRIRARNLRLDKLPPISPVLGR